MRPHRRLDILGPHLRAGADLRAGTEEAVLAPADIVAPPLPRLLVDAEHSQPADTAGEQAAEQVVMARVVAEGELRVARELILGTLVGLLVNERRDGDGDPFLARARLAADVVLRAGPLRTARLGRAHEPVAVGVGRTGVDGVSQDVVDDRVRPGP